ncbi:MAG TPA: hypothetical protein VE078_10860, partial [Thermoanaerobaculia bacterium]|nr:hypothetical protein [Thermoanaerobaculia bacterium]
MRYLAGIAGMALAALAIVPPLDSAAASPSSGFAAIRVSLGDGVVAALTEKEGIFLEAVPQKGEGLLAFTRRLCGDDRLAPQVAEANGSNSNTMLAGIRYRVPFDLLSNSWHLKLAQALFPGDKGQADGWRHEARGVGTFQRESLWQLSLWFTGTGENFRAIREYNELLDDDVPRGTAVVIPSELLRPAFKAVLPVPEKPYHLTYGKDEEGEFAIYRLRPGEALYSSVVVRFTGRVHAQDVNQLAAEIAERSGVVDVTDIPIGYR